MEVPGSAGALVRCLALVGLVPLVACASSASEAKACDEPMLRITVTYPDTQDFCDVTQGRLVVDFPSGDANVDIVHWNQRFFDVAWPSGTQRGDMGEIRFEATGPSERGQGETTVTANPGDCTDVILEATCGAVSPADAGPVVTIDAGMPDGMI